MKPIPKEKCEKPIETPRTDAHKWKLKDRQLPTEVVIADFARQLEREVIQLRQAGESIAERLKITDNHLLHAVVATTARHENKLALLNWNSVKSHDPRT